VNLTEPEIRNGSVLGKGICKIPKPALEFFEIFGLVA